MSCSNLEKSEASTHHNNSLEYIEIEASQSDQPKHTLKNAKTLELVYLIIMGLISAIILKKHSISWKKWTSILSGIIYLLLRISSRKDK
jgi:hypothetical protein